jgi:hypothetical protein
MVRISYRDRLVTTRTAPDCLDAVRHTLAVLGAEIHTSDSCQIVGKLGSRLKTRLIGALIGGWSVSADLPVKIQTKVDDYGEGRELEIVAEEDAGFGLLGLLTGHEGRYRELCQEVARQILENCRQPDLQRVHRFKQSLKQNQQRRIAIRSGIRLTILACLFPPLKFLGLRTWGFIFGDAGFGMANFQFIDAGMLILELLLIWGIIGGIYYLDQLRTLGTASPLPTQPGYKFCTECGSKIHARDSFCAECGAKCV